MLHRPSVRIPVIIVLFVLSVGILPSRPARRPVSRRSVNLTDAQSILDEANRLSWLNNWAAAGPLYERAEVLFKTAGDKWNQTYARVGRLGSQAGSIARNSISRALRLQLNAPIAADPRLRLWCLAILGYTSLDFDTPTSKRAWTEAFEIAHRIGETKWALRAEGELGTIAFLEGNPTRAVSLVGHALMTEHAAGDFAGQARLFAMLGYGYNEVHRFTEALWFFNNSVAVTESTPDAGFPSVVYLGEAQALSGKGNQWQAVLLLRLVLSNARIEKNLQHQADALLLLGEMALISHDLEKAKTYLEETRRIAGPINVHRDLAPAMLDLAEVYRIEGNLDKADELMQSGLKSSRRLGNRYYLPRDLTAAAELKVAERKFNQADLLFAEAENVIDQMLLNQHTDYGKAALAGAMSETYLKHFRLVEQQGNLPRAFHLIERVRGRAEASRLYEHHDEPQNSPAEKVVEGSVASDQRALLVTEDQRGRLALEDKLLQDERTLAYLDNEVSGNQWPLLAPASLKAVQDILMKGELLLEYVLDDPHAFCIAVTRDRTLIIELPSGSKQIQDLVESFLRELQRKDQDKTLPGHLYSVLLKQALGDFHSSRLIIAPDGILNALPFEALNTDAGEALVQSQVISYTPSATVLRLLRTAKRQPAVRPLIAVGDVEYADRHIPVKENPSRGWIPSGVVRDLLELSEAHLENLPESREEVLTIAHIAGPDSRLLLGRDATESAFKKQRISEYRVVHLALHALADSIYPDRSALVFAADHPPEDGLLQVREIRRLRLAADLVTLSACRTGVGTPEGEAGVLSLEQAFLEAGAQAVVASLWNVEDQSTTVLMKYFYGHLAAHEDKATALTHAKRDFLKANADLPPYYWAGFVLVGDGSSVVIFGK